MWTRSGPIIDNTKGRMSNLLYNMSPKRRYFVRVFSRNEIGESNKTAVTPVMTLEPTINIYRVKAVFVVLLIVIAVVLSKDVFVVALLVLAVTLAIYGLITFFFLRRKVEPVDNQLYLSSDDPDLATVHNLRTQSVMNTSLPSNAHDNQTYQIQLHNEDGGKLYFE
ncbi:unnamed protein product [Mytilus coruscus]|uniref:Fibronectin type-III domain-containing protein n=1 Tax=Mytilus coruscus TaxID=42192 RepID=A0A6J8EPR1_MYTCO|nr:unnamed protein product [Mytilus coruscus]